MYSFKRTIDGKDIAPLNEGATQVAPLPDFTAESQFIIVTIPEAPATRSVQLPDNISGFEIETELTELRISHDSNLALSDPIPSTVNQNAVASNFTHGVIAPTERRAFNLGTVKTLYLKSSTAGKATIYVF